MNPFKAFALTILLTTQAVAEEEIVSLSPSIISEEKTPLPIREAQASTVSTNKTIVYGSLSIIPGGGVSIRERRGSKGTALDCKMGMLPFPFDTVSWIPIVSVDYNFLYFSKDAEVSPYFSYGIGGAYIIPYIPLRAGIEFEHGFVDIGAKLVMGFIPSPEIRAGVEF
ncbi:MAG TPA: hypothetical protein VLE89_07260 [Chlamydiales bacterium]|nr:hypothetical protein [Chlamydiales bacterium]